MSQAKQTHGALFIIGAGPGIGLAVAERFGREGSKIVLSSRNPKRLDPLVAALVGKGIDAHGLVLDATDAAALRTAMRNADRMTGGLTAVLYNAANVRQQDLSAMTDAEVEGDVAVNITGALHAIRAAQALFAASGGTILVTGGGLAVTPHASYASLGLGKAALRNLVQGLAAPLAAQDIRIGIATIATLVAAGSPEALGAAEAIWSLATAEAAPGAAPWEITYPTA
ncbi:SDR family oxidoreductase [Humitalea sp. 24SJ18S-53]|uniref:SDR family oxidoreductase n=1 Tax=Humitalea sp. 24SJ18S-53 TaxID=3422307 RepID=UPI003D667F8D